MPSRAGAKEAAGPNLFLHLLVPLAAIAEIIFLSDTVYTARDNALAVIPTMLYGAVYLLNNFINGMAIFMIICVITWLIGLLMRKCSAARRRRTE